MIIRHCAHCLYPETHPLGLVLDEEGICSGCRIHKEKDIIDWPERWQRLESLVKPYRSRTGDNYDCIVPVTGAQDSYFILHLVKNCLKLNPLLVTYNKYFNTPLGIANLANLRIQFDCDLLVQNVNPQSVKKITRSTLRMLGSMYWPSLAGQTVFPVQTALRYGVPLIIWGAHQGLEQVGMFSHEHEVEMTRRYRKDHDLMGIEADDLLSIFDTVKEEDIWQYRYPDDYQLRSVGVRGIYLGNFVRWDPKAQHELMIKKYSYQTSRLSRTFDCYDYVDCFNYLDIHDELKLLKHGFSKVTDHVCREIRHGRLTRSDGVALIAHYEGKPSVFTQHFIDWLGLDSTGLNFIFDQHRNPRFWKQSRPGAWVLEKRGFPINEVYPKEPATKMNFTANSTLTLGRGDGYIVFGKGWGS